MESRHLAPRRRPPQSRGSAGHGPDPRRRRPPQRRRPPKKNRSFQWDQRLGWLILAAALVLGVALLLIMRSCGGKETAPAEQSPVNNSPVSVWETDATAAPFKTAEGSGGRKVEVGAIHTGFTPPESVTVGVLKSADLTALGETVHDNAAASGWGDVTWSLGENGELLLRNASQIVLSGADYKKQEAFLASAQPENLARTFLENSGLIPLLRSYGLNLRLDAENEEGRITFRGSGDAPGEDCAITFSFLYTGAFNQAVLRASYLDGAMTSERVLSLAKAAENAVTWSSADSGKITVIDAELRSIHGLPFYVLTGADGTVAYALAVEESVLDAVPGAREVYASMMQSGIQEYVEISGAG